MTHNSQRVLIAGAAGRDFHNFNCCYRDNPDFEVVAFTATQIPNISGRRYPHELAGALYPAGIPIYPESEIETLIRDLQVDVVVFAYSDVSYPTVMHLASRALAAGADFQLIGPRQTQLKSRVPVVSIGAVRTGCGKSQTTRRVISELQALGFANVVSIRHPMPYGDLVAQAVQRFATIDDLAQHNCTIEEMEEYEPTIAMGAIVYAGVDYGAILTAAEAEADVIVWDGGNNDWPFYQSDYHMVLVDPHRPGHELAYYPAEVNLRMADAVIVNKIDTAEEANVELVIANVRRINPAAQIVHAASPLAVDNPAAIAGQRVLVIEDGPTLTHGEMAYGAGVMAARQWGAAEIVDPRPYAVGSLAETYRNYPNTGPVLPAMGYGAQQIADLSETIRRTPADLILVATPIDLGRIIAFDKPHQRVRYSLAEIGTPTLRELLQPLADRAQVAALV